LRPKGADGRVRAALGAASPWTWMMVTPATWLSRSLAPLPSLRSVTAPAVRRDALPKSSEEGDWRWPRARTESRRLGLRSLAGREDGRAAGR
jgi:hypothetical protein